MTLPRRRRLLRTLALGTVAAVSLGLLAAGPATSAGAAASAPPASSPTGVVEHFLLQPGGMSFSGWASDPVTTTPISVYITVDGTASKARGAKVVANLPRTGRSTGAGHGFDTTVLLPTGRHTICVWALNTATKKTKQLACRVRTLVYSPQGQVQSFRTLPGAIHVSGWAVDSDVPTTPISVRVTIDGTPRLITAGLTNSVVATRFPWAGTKHGFAATIPVAQGLHQVCVTAVNVGYGSDTALRCDPLTLSESPVGGLDEVRQNAGKLQVRGWTYDPDAPTTALTVAITVNGTLSTVTARLARTDIGTRYPKAGKYHGFDARLTLPEGAKRVCVTARNLSFGSNHSLGCRSVTLNFTPTAALTSLGATATGLTTSGWATDPDTGRAIRVVLSVDGHARPSLLANGGGGSHPGHRFSATIAMRSGKHTVCAVAINTLYGTHNSRSACRTITLALRPLGAFETLARATGSTNLVATGWAFDPDTTGRDHVSYTVDGVAAGSFETTIARPDITKRYPGAGSSPHGFAHTLTADDGEHRVCAVAKNVGGGSDLNLGCKIINAVHPVAPSAPRSVVAVAGYGGATLTWQAPASDGGAPWSKYVVSAFDPKGVAAGSVTTAAGTTSATVLNLKPATTYTFVVTAANVAGTSAAGTSKAVKTQASPPAQRTPAPVSTSRYIRNIRGSGSADLATMRAEGAADARANPSGHGYLILLDIGGQDQQNGGVLLSATTRFVSYSDLVKAVNAYVDGYHGAQKLSAPVTIAIGTNNDVDVSNSSGRAWADRVIDPIRSYASRYTSITVAGANDIEPGFSATYSQTKAWLTGYLAATSAPFVFNGSADGCAWTVTARGCNNGWSMAGLYYLSTGAAPTRSLNLPQVYNTTMAAQWKYISLTGVQGGSPRINFGGPLTEWTACDQTNSCGSLTGHTAWSAMWSNLQSDPRLKVASLPYSTDLRIDR